MHVIYIDWLVKPIKDTELNRLFQYEIAAVLWVTGLWFFTRNINYALTVCARLHKVRKSWVNRTRQSLKSWVVEAHFSLSYFPMAITIYSARRGTPFLWSKELRRGGCSTALWRVNIWRSSPPLFSLLPAQRAHFYSFKAWHNIAREVLLPLSASLFFVRLVDGADHSAVALSALPFEIARKKEGGREEEARVS